VAIAPENEEAPYDDLPSGSSQRTPVVEVMMPRSDSPPIAKRAGAPSSNANDRAKRAMYVVGSPASRLMNQMAMSPTIRSPLTRLRSPGPSTTQNSHGTTYPSCR
jgi:hypothetical protein